jgi:hypothetical protein
MLPPGQDPAQEEAHQRGAQRPVPGPRPSAVLKVSGLNEPETPLYPSAQTIAASGLTDTDVSWLALPTLALGTVVQVVPSQCRVGVCGPVVYPTAHTSEAERAVIPVSVPAAGLGVMVHAVPFQCAMSGPDGLLPACGRRKPMPSGDIHESRRRRGHVVEPEPVKVGGSFCTLRPRPCSPPTSSMWTAW